MARTVGAGAAWGCNMTSKTNRLSFEPVKKGDAATAVTVTASDFKTPDTNQRMKRYGI